MPTNYSYPTSLPAYHENQSGKELQKESVFNFIKCGINNLKWLAEKTEIIPAQCAMAGASWSVVLKAVKMQLPG